MNLKHAIMKDKENLKKKKRKTKILILIVFQNIKKNSVVVYFLAFFLNSVHQTITIKKKVHLNATNLCPGI